MKKLGAFFLSFIVAFVSLGTVPLMAADASARSISILAIEGTSVTMTKGAVKEFKAREGLTLLDGYTVSTGANSGATLNLDDTATAVMDQKSKVEISKLSSNKLSVSVLSGTVAVNADPQKAGESVEIGAGNSTMAIRGTLFTLGHAGGAVQVNMLEGKGDFDGRPVSTGETLSYSPGKAYATEALVIDENSPAFLLKTVIANQDKLLAMGLYSAEEIANIQATVDKIEAAEKAAQAAAAQQSSSGSSSGSSSSGSSSSSGNNSSSGGNNNNNGSTTVYTIKYDLDGDWDNAPVLAPQTRASGQSFVPYDIPEEREKPEYKFVRWTDAAGKEYKAGHSYSATANLTLTAVWVKEDGETAPEVFTIKYDMNGGDWTPTFTPESVTVTSPGSFDAAFISPEHEKSKHDFDYWKDQNGEKYCNGQEGITPKSDLTLTAVWKPQEEESTKKVTLIFKENTRPNSASEEMPFPIDQILMPKIPDDWNIRYNRWAAVLKHPSGGSVWHEFWPGQQLPACDISLYKTDEDGRIKLYAWPRDNDNNQHYGDRSGR